MSFKIKMIYTKNSYKIQQKQLNDKCCYINIYCQNKKGDFIKWKKS